MHLLVVRLLALENSSVEPKEFLTDGDEDDLPPEVKAVLEASNGMAPSEVREVCKDLFPIMSGVDCVCISTLKGTVNLGIDMS